MALNRQIRLRSRSIWMGFALVVSRRCNQLHRLTGDRDQCVVTYRALD